MTASTNFLGALRSGQEAALQAEKNRREIQQVFAELGEQVREFSAGALAVRLVDPAEKPRYVADAQATPRPHHLVVEKSHDAHSLCDVFFGERGYPVEIRYARRFVGVHDRDALIAELNDLLASPHVGRIFNQLLGVPEAPPANDGA